MGNQNPQLYIQQVQDNFIRLNFQNLADYFSKQNQLLDFNFLEVEFTAAEDEKKVLHGLPSIPKDLLRMQATGAGRVTFHRSLFDADAIYISATAACKLRFFVGTYFQSPAPLAIESGAVDYWFLEDAGTEVQEVPTGEINSSNLNFLLANLPRSDASVKLYVNGILQRQGTHYTLDGRTIVFVSAPTTGQRIDAVYSH